MKENLTELIFILDRSGSMFGLENDTIGGFNAMLEKQKQEPGQVLVTTVLFDNLCEVIHDRTDLLNIAPMTRKDYYVRGSTALLDAVGKTVAHIAKIHKYAREEDRPDKTLFVITTDGMENASRDFTYERVKNLIHRHQARDGWEFLFLGANIDAAKEAARFGIDRDHTADYLADSQGTTVLYEAVNDAVCSIRTDRPMDKAWKHRIDADYRKRTKTSG